MMPSTDDTNGALDYLRPQASEWHRRFVEHFPKAAEMSATDVADLCIAILLRRLRRPQSPTPLSIQPSSNMNNEKHPQEEPA